MANRPRAVFFDLGETLVTQNIEDNIVTRQALEEITRTLHLTRSPAQLFRAYQQGYLANHNIRSRHHVEIPVQTWMGELLTKALSEEASVPMINRAIEIIVRCRASNAVAFKDAKVALVKLAGRHFRLGVISNVSSHEVALQIMKNVGLYKYVDRIITSAQTGIRKPDPGIFLYALRTFGLKPNQTIHVGDSEHHDIWGAKPVGITTVLVKKKPFEIDTDADYRTRNLEETSNFIVSLQRKG